MEGYLFCAVFLSLFMYADHVRRTFLHPIPKYKKSPEPRKIPGIFRGTPDWIRTSDLPSRSCLNPYVEPSEGGAFWFVRLFVFPIGAECGIIKKI